MEIPIPISLKKDISSYCKANKINDVDKFIVKMLRQGFNIEKYGVEPKKQELNPISTEVPDNIKAIKDVMEHVEKKKKTKTSIKKVEENKNKDLYGE